MVRTRIAPSPTGSPHIGTMYQGLFDWAYARKHGGQFIVRIEDTDRSRFVEGAEEELYRDLDWLGLTEDESPRRMGSRGPYRQSERLDLYRKYALELVNKDIAYYCFCSQQRLEKVRKEMQEKKKSPMYDKYCCRLNTDEVQSLLSKKTAHVIRLKVPNVATITVHDEIRGDITFDARNIDDQVLIKSDGYPTYHLAVVVDDHEMDITHIVRGEEWIPSSPKHKLIYDSLGWKIPKLYHTPLLRNPDKSKLSKRHNHVSIEWYRSEGFLPEALLNFLALLGWSHPEGKEIFSLEEFVERFDLSDLKAIGPIFDVAKLEWMNGEYIRSLREGDLFVFLDRFLPSLYDRRVVKKTIPLIHERIKKMGEYLHLCDFFFSPPSKYEQDLISHKDLLHSIAGSLEDVVDWKAGVIGETMQGAAQREGIKNRDFFMILRIAITGKKITPPLNESMELLGREECVERLKKAVKK